MGRIVSTLKPGDREPRFIVVEGPIGVGKSSLARRLADSFGAELILEPQAENPFLERFYKEGRKKRGVANAAVFLVSAGAAG